MDSAKKAAFVKMATKHRVKFSKGGLIRRLGNRKYFDTGGTALNGPNDGGTSNNATNPNSGLLGTVNQGLGLNNNFQASAANIQQGTNAAQLNNAYTGVQGGLNQQGQLANTLAPQVSSAVGNQNALANQYLAMSQGQGPNPAQNQLAQATGQNIANQNAAAAGQRGAAGNVGLMERQAAQQGAATQQQSAGQAATLGAQQQIAAQQNLANLSNNQISQAGQATTGVNSAQQNEQSILQNANTSFNNAGVASQSNINNVNAQTSAANQNMASNTLGGITSLVTSPASLLAKGGMVGKDHHIKLAEMNAVALKHGMQHFDDGGDVDQPNLGTFKAGDDSTSSPDVGATAALPTDNTNLSSAVNKPSSITGGGSGGGGGGIMSLAAMFAPGGEVAPIGANPLIGTQQTNGPGSWVGNYMSSSASSGPNVEGMAALPKNSVDLSKSVNKEPKKKKDPDTSGAQGGPTGNDTPDQGTPANTTSGGPSAMIGQTGPDDTAATDKQIPFAQGGMTGHFHRYFSEGGDVPAMVSPGEIYLDPDKVQKVIHEGVDPAKIGHKFHGKAKVKGDSLKNDNIPTTLKEGGVVIDRKNMSTRQKRELFVHKAVAKAKARR